MAANMPMANGQLMMQQQQQQQHNQQQQRALQSMVYQALANSQQSAPPNGWQAAVPVQERLGKTINL